MCELLAMSANTPTDICFSFKGLKVRGGDVAPHRDGWGIAFYEGRAARLFKDPSPSAASPIADLVERYPIKSEVIIAHIRQANSGGVCLENTHPFSRELYGREWVYAHNGQLPGVFELPLGRFKPIGDTDSERAFCWLLDQIERAGLAPEAPDRAARLAALLKARGDQLAAMGVFNLLLSDGAALYVYCATKLHWIIRAAPFKRATLRDRDVSVDFKEETTPQDRVAILSTEPLTADEVWTAMAPGELLAWRGGAIAQRLG